MKKNLNRYTLIVLLSLTSLIWISLNIFLIYYSYQVNVQEVPQNIIKQVQTNLLTNAGIPSIKTNLKTEGKIIFGTIAFLPNTLKTFILSDSNWIGMEPGQTVYEHDQLKTSSSSQVDIQLSSSKKIRI